MTKGSQARRQKKLNEKVAKKAGQALPAEEKNPFETLAGAILQDRKRVDVVIEQLKHLGQVHDQNAAIFQQTLQALELETVILRRLLVDNGVELQAIEAARVTYVDEWYGIQGLAAFAAAAKVYHGATSVADVPKTAEGIITVEEQNADYNTMVFGGA